MRKLVTFFVELILAGLLVAWIFERFPKAVDHVIPWIGLAILWHLTWEIVFDAEPIKKQATTAYRKLGKMGWLIAFSVGGCISLGYWYSIKYGLTKLQAEAEPTFNMPDNVFKNHDGLFDISAMNIGPDIERVKVKYEYFVAERHDSEVIFHRLGLFRPAVPDVPLKTNQAVDMTRLIFTENYVNAYKEVLGHNRASILGLKITMTFTKYGDAEILRRIWVYNALGQVPGEPPITLMSSTIDKPGPPETQKDVLTGSEVVPFIDQEKCWDDYVFSFNMGKGRVIHIP